MTSDTIQAERQLAELTRRLKTTTGETTSSVLRRAPSAMTPDGVLDPFEKFEKARAAILAEESRTSEWKLAEIERITSDMDAEFHKLETAEVVNKIRDLDRDDGAILAGIKAANSDSQAAALSATTIANDLTVASSISDAPMLADLFDEAVLSGHEDRIRRVGAVITTRLQTLAVGSSGNEAIHAVARRVIGEYRAWSSAHPSAPARLRANREKRDRVEATVREQFAVTRERLRFKR